jgi:tRNA (guanine-N7-)-methyltransferase
MALPAEYPANRTYGRRKGHRLSPRKQRLWHELLPTLRPDTSGSPPRPLTALFDAQVSEVWLEIGFGAGEHLLWQAGQNPQAGIIGCEPYVNGVAALLGALDETNARNVRIWDGDARKIIGWLPGSSLSRAFILHPDPWPKARHQKRRFVSPENLEMLSRVMQPSAELRIATDIANYVRSSLEAIRVNGKFEWLAEGPRDWSERPADWPQTRYEKKALKEGRSATYLRFSRR